MTDPDIALLHRYAVNREATAFAELVDRYESLVYGACLRILGNRADAEDAAQECFLRLALKAEAITSSVPGWLHRCATGIAINQKKQQQARAARERAYSDLRIEPAEGNEELSWKELSPHVDQAIDGLPDDLRHIIVECFLRKRSQKEVAAELNIPASTMSDRVNLGVETIRNRLKKAGIIGSATVLASLVMQNAVQAAPETLTAALGKMAVAGVGKGVIAAGTGAAKTGAAAAATAIKTKLIVGAAAVAIAAGGVVAWKQFNQAPPPPPPPPAVAAPLAPAAPPAPPAVQPAPVPPPKAVALIADEHQLFTREAPTRVFGEFLTQFRQAARSAAGEFAALRNLPEEDVKGIELPNAERIHTWLVDPDEPVGGPGIVRGGRTTRTWNVFMVITDPDDAEDVKRTESRNARIIFEVKTDDIRMEAVLYRIADAVQIDVHRKFSVAVALQTGSVARLEAGTPPLAVFFKRLAADGEWSRADCAKIAEVLSQLGDSAIPGLIKSFGDAADRQRFIERLGEIRGVAAGAVARKTLIEIWRKGDKTVNRTIYAILLTGNRGADAIEVYRAHLAAEAARWRSPEGRCALSPESVASVRQTILALADYRDRAAEPEVRKVYAFGDDWRCHVAAAEALSALRPGPRDGEIAKALAFARETDSLDMDYVRTQRQSAKEIMEFQDETILPRLMDVCMGWEDRDYKGEHALFLDILKQRSEAVCRHIRPALASDYQCEQAARLLRALGIEPFRAALEGWANTDPDPNVRKRAGGLLKGLAPARKGGDDTF